MTKHTPDETVEQNEANMHLIAAAPEMYEALKTSKGLLLAFNKICRAILWQENVSEETKQKCQELIDLLKNWDVKLSEIIAAAEGRKIWNPVMYFKCDSCQKDIIVNEIRWNDETPLCEICYQKEQPKTKAEGKHD